MIDTLVVHGSFGSPYENWFPWLRSTLTAAGRRVLVPNFPDKDLQDLDRWTRVLDGYAGCFEARTNIFGHSLAAAFIADYCVAKRMRVGKAILVAPFYGLIGIPEFDAVNRTFFKNQRTLETFATMCDQIICVYSDNDPYVPLHLFEEFAAITKAERRIVHGGGHLNAEAGYREFPLLLDL